jgi:tRNA pseudouridine13 synthase
MRYKVQPEDFVVEERIQLPLAHRGPFAAYRVRKRGVTTLGVQARMARSLGVGQADVVFPALKDKEAVVVQHATVRGTGPTHLAGNGFEAEFLGRSSRPLSPGDVVANRFTLVLRDMPTAEVERLQERLALVAKHGLLNYFDRQRFGSLTPGEEPIGKCILQRDAEGALRAYLTQPFAGDPAPVRTFKNFAAAHWRDWERMFEAAPRPSNFRSVLTYLRDHPGGDAAHYRKALNLVTRRLLGIYLVAYQSLLWNRIAARYLVAQEGEAPAYIEVAGERLPVYRELPGSLDPDAAIPLPNHRAAYPDPEMATVVAQVLAEERLALNDLKARILKRAYLPKGKRRLMLVPQDVSASPPEPDDRFPGQHKLTLIFTLPRGSYATLVIKALAA